MRDDRFNRYSHVIGPERALRNLDDWTSDTGREARKLDAACDARDADSRVRKKAVPDVYEVADRVLAPLLDKKSVRSVPARLKQDVTDNLAARGVKHPSKKQRLREATRLLAGIRAAGDIELSLGLLLAAAHLWEPEGGWKAHTPRGPRIEGFSSLQHLLSAAFDSVALGAGCVPLEIAQNRARTRSLDGEVFVQASRSSTGRARGVDALTRSIDAQAIVYRSAVDMSVVPLLFERHVLGRYRSADDMVDELRIREARARKVALPPRPSSKASESEIEAWRLACGIAVWGEDPEQALHVRHHDRAALRKVTVAEDALRVAIGIKRRGRPAELQGVRSRGIADAGYAHA
jgi:hypothetical protein